MMGQFGFFDADRRLAAITAKGDPLEMIARVVPFESFRAEIEAAVLTPVSEKKSTAGRKPIDVMVMFRMPVLQSLYNLSDEAVAAVVVCQGDGDSVWITASDYPVVPTVRRGLPANAGNRYHPVLQQHTSRQKETVMRERCSGSMILVAIAGAAAVISVTTDRTSAQAPPSFNAEEQANPPAGSRMALGASEFDHECETRPWLVAAIASARLSGEAYPQGSWTPRKPIPQGANEVIGAAVDGLLYVYGGERMSTRLLARATGRHAAATYFCLWADA
jgi:hypothetical protein